MQTRKLAHTLCLCAGLMLGCEDNEVTRSTDDAGSNSMDSGGGTSSDGGGATVDSGMLSDGLFSDTSPINFESQIQPLFTANCALSGCHSGTTPRAELNLEQGPAYAELVGVTSGQCSALDLIEPGDAEASYLIQKLEGQGDCFQGQQMPFGADPLDPINEILLIRAWIEEGANP